LLKALKIKEFIDIAGKKKPALLGEEDTG